MVASHSAQTFRSLKLPLGVVMKAVLLKALFFESNLIGVQRYESKILAYGTA